MQVKRAEEDTKEEGDVTIIRERIWQEKKKRIREK